MNRFHIPALNHPLDNCGLLPLKQTNDQLFTTGKDGVSGIFATGDRKLELVVRNEQTLACVRSSLGYPAYYPLAEDAQPEPLEALLMDLDGTTVKSEEFWVSIIEMTTASLLKNPHFSLEESDLPYVSGHSVSEHLEYCLAKYAPGHTLVEARTQYYEHTHREMDAILHKGKSGAFTPAEGIKDFLLEMKGHGLKLGLVTSGLYEKAYPEILSAFRTLGMGDPADFYDAIITAGHALGQGTAGTLGELEPKPHPWLYAETAVVGLGIPYARRGAVAGIEDSGAGVCSIRLAGFETIGISGGNILSSGTSAFCHHYCQDFASISRLLSARLSK